MFDNEKKHSTQLPSGRFEYWRVLRDEMLTRVQEACPREDISSQPRILYFCEQLAFRTCGLKLVHEFRERGENLTKAIEETLTSLLSLPVDVVTFHPAKMLHSEMGPANTRELLKAIRTRDTSS
jgi:hypothetical protein